MRTSCTWALMCLVTAGAGAQAVDYDVIYVRQARFGDDVNTIWPEVFHPARLDPGAFHNLELVGEVIREGRLFEGFRYRFEGPTPDGWSPLERLSPASSGTVSISTSPGCRNRTTASGGWCRRPGSRIRSDRSCPPARDLRS